VTPTDEGPAAGVLQPRLSPGQFNELLRLLGEIDEFKGYWRKLRELRAERLGELLQITTIESAGSSTRIEGAELSDAEVAQVLGGLSLDSFRARDEAEVRGYGELLQLIFDHHRDLPLEERYILQLHGVLLKHCDADAWHRGRWKKNPNNVEARHPDGRREVIFETATPFDTPRLMSELVTFTGTSLADAAAHPLVVVARFVVQFLAIHPFQDGNGRLSRALTTLLLLRTGYEYVPYSSLERVIEENRAAYYAALRTSQTAMRNDTSAFSEWLLFLLRALRAQQQNLLAKLDVERSMQRLSAVQERILELVDRHGRVTTTLLATTLELPPRTVRYHLDILIRHGLIEATGEKRGRTYRRATAAAAPVPGPDWPTAAILAAVLEAGGRIRAGALTRLVKKQGYDARVVGTLHGRRHAHLRRVKGSDESVLTARGREIAEQYMFARRLARIDDEDTGATT
jgi:Fic family protein